MRILKRNLLRRVLILALLCFVFLGLKDGPEAKADEPTATARVIYANNVEFAEDNGQVIATAASEYSFVQGENYYPYAVYVTSDAASGASIEIDTTSAGLNVNSTIIKIWDNNCGVNVITEPGGYVDKFSLVLTGDDSYIDVGWSHFNHGGCDAAIYRGEDDAGAIADYFNNNFRFFDEETNNGLMLSANYWNDESVTMGYDAGITEQNPEDPHYGKTVYNVTWNMEVTNLTLDPDVVLFLQNNVFPEGGMSVGMLKVSGCLTIGSGSYIESIDGAPRLEITGDNLAISGMSLYDYDNNSSETPLSQGYEYVGQYYYHGEKKFWTKSHGSAPTDAIGNPEVTTAAKKYIYAYNLLDFDGDGSKENNDLTFALASELLIKFRNMYGDFGLRDNHEGDREEVWEKVFGDAMAMRDRIAIDFDNPETITATSDDGSTVDIDRYTATVSWGYSETGEEIKDTVYVYRLPLMDYLLICTDYDESTGSGSKYYLRRSFDDKKVLIGAEDTDPNTVHEDYFTSVVVDDFTNVVAGGHGVSMYVKNTDTNMFTFQTISYTYMKNRKTDGNKEWVIINQDTFVKVFKPTGKFFATASEGEEKRYDFVSHDATCNAADKIWEAGGQYPVKLFIHDTKLHIMPLNNNSGVAKELKEVRLIDALPEGAVTIDNTNTADILITFNSKFYDTVKFELVYADDSTGTFTIEREGIIIQSTGLGFNRKKPGGPDQGRYWLDIYGEGDGNELNYTYDCDTENFVVMATYYHSSAETGVNNLKLVVTYDDGATEIIDSIDTTHNFSGYKSGADYDEGGTIPAAVDTTSFIVGFMKADGTDFTFSKNGHTGGFSVQVVNAGFDGTESFGGALAGSGKGKYWDGHVSY